MLTWRGKRGVENDLAGGLKVVPMPGMEKKGESR
jgi:hypothetical protein